MANDITKVYQFLGTLGDWKSKMDKNGDGTIIKYEFREFMNNDFEWDGTPTDSEKNSLIDQFWAKFDTNKNGKISGTNYRNKNALSNDEVNTMQETIGVYENLNTYTSKLKAPAGLDSTKWKESVTSALTNLTETFIKQGGKADDLEAYLDSQIKTIEAKTTTDYYALAVSDKYKSQLNNYDLYNDDTFKGFVDAYIEAKITKAADDNSIPSVTDIKAEIDKIAEAYMATAEKQLMTVEETNKAYVTTVEDEQSTEATETTDADDNANVLSEDPYNYDQKDTDPLNGLQKSKIKAAAKPALEEAVKADENYNSYKNAYDTALNEFFDEALNSLKKSDFTEFLNDGTIPTSINVTTFKASTAYKNIQNTITIDNTMNNIDENSDLYKQLADTYGEDFANRVKNDGKYISAMQEIKNSVIEKMKNGDYDTNGEFDTAKLIKDIVSQLGSNMTSFYANGFGDLELDDLNKVYESLVKSASEQTDTGTELQQRRDAAVMYCDALASKESYKSAVTEVFGTDYKTAIGKMLPTEINEKIAKLQKLADEVVDVSKAKLSDSSWSDLDGNISIPVGKTKSFSLAPAFVDENGTSLLITSDKITYKSSNTSVATVDSTGKITVNGQKGTYQTTISILVNGKEVGTKTITVKGNESIDFKNLSDVKYDDNSTIASILATGNKTLRVSDWNTDTTDCNTKALTSIIAQINKLANILKASGQFDSDRLDKATTTLTNYYTAALSVIDFNQDAGSGKRSHGYIDRTFTYKDADGIAHTENTKYHKQTAKHERNTTGYTNAGNIDHDSLGLAICESYNRSDTYQCTLNISVLIEKFASFYNAM